MSWKVLAHSATGTSHEWHGHVCQDCCRTALIGPDQSWLAVALADGAGSATQAAIGAELACTELLNELSQQTFTEPWTREQVLRLLQTVRDKLQHRADTGGHTLRDYACTVLLAVVAPESAMYVQVGDGAIVAGDRVIFWPEPAEYANVTDFLTDANFATAIQWAWHQEPVTELALLSDGLQRLALDYTTQSPHAKFFAPLFRRLRDTEPSDELASQYVAFLNSPAINARTDDDKTLVLAVRCS